MTEATLSTSATLRTTGPLQGAVVLCLSGGTGQVRPGVWGASIEYLVRRLAPRVPHLGFAELRYRVRSWRQMDLCIEDGRAAIDALVAGGADSVLLIGYSMGGAVSCSIADHRAVARVIGLAPWLPPELPYTAMRGRHFDILHGTLDRSLPGVPGVTPESSRRGFRRIVDLGATGTYQLIRGGGHAIALRGPRNWVVPLPFARRWAREVHELLDTYES